MLPNHASPDGGELSACAATQPQLLCCIAPSLPRRNSSIHAASRRTSIQPTAAVQALHEMPDEVLSAVMGLLSTYDAVKLGSLHPALRRALGTCPGLEPSLVLEVSTLRDGARTRGDTAADYERRLRGGSFRAFSAAHPRIVISAMTLQLELDADELLRFWQHSNIKFASDWLPLRCLKKLHVKTSTLVRAQVIAAQLQGELHSNWAAAPVIDAEHKTFQHERG